MWRSFLDSRGLQAGNLENRYWLSRDYGMKCRLRPSQNIASLALCVSVACFQCIGSASKLAASDRVAVSDSKNNRVLIFDMPLRTNESASVVLGQADFFHGSPNRGGGPAANTLNSPGGLAKDSFGYLYVVDLGNCRILQFRPPFTNGMNASLVIQDPGFASTSCNIESTDFRSQAKGLIVPVSVTVDGSGNLFVVDAISSRVFKYAPPFTRPKPVLGQGNAADVYANDCEFPHEDTTARTLCHPAGTAFDSEGNLWVADSSDNRVLRFAPPFSPGKAAGLELGQPAESAFTSNSARTRQCGQDSTPDDPNPPEDKQLCPSGAESPSNESLNHPSSLAFDVNGNLWVADSFNGRILKFAPPFTNGMAALTVIGKEDFRHQSSGAQHRHVSANTLFNGTDLAFDSSGNLLVVDHLQHRILVFNPPFENGMPATTVLGSADFNDTNFTRGGQYIPERQRRIAANLFDEPLALVVF